MLRQVMSCDGCGKTSDPAAEAAEHPQPPAGGQTDAPKVISMVERRMRTSRGSIRGGRRPGGLSAGSSERAPCPGCGGYHERSWLQVQRAIFGGSVLHFCNTECLVANLARVEKSLDVDLFGVSSLPPGR